MSFTTSDYEQLQLLMGKSPENKALIQKLLDTHQYTVSKISHEIRNPLSLVYSMLQMTETQHPEVRTFKYWGQICDDLEFINQLLNELSAYNNSERLRRELFSFTELLKKICLSFAVTCSDTDIEFTSLVISEPVMYNGDSVKLREAILNLLKNAKEAISGNGSIYLETTLTENHFIIRISDTGCGIAVEDLNTIFDTFVTHKTGGTGLGLAIVQKTIMAHNGCISVDSTPNKGTTFVLQFPIT